ncbi:TIGR01458 family HAD-type hydrolase [Limibacter armeniacum]|uniref:TIGR01458 family HAD-type hydrolase n=1 Tax=Limibacter armeniacum TaxID=466084 RepID=UPI002FE5E354
MKRQTMENDWLKDIEGVLCDLDGVVYISETPIAGSIEAIRILKQKQIPIRFLTNTSGRPVASIHERLVRMGVDVGMDEIITPPVAAANYLKAKGIRSIYPVVSKSIRAYFNEQFELVETNPEVVVIGDIGDVWDYELMSRIFKLVMEGAEMLTLHKGRFWKTEAGLKLDIGAFVAGLEYSTGKKAYISGKPGSAFFEMGVNSLGLTSDKVLMIGDDVDGDIGGAQNAGVKGILVRTGKFRQEILEASPVTPDLVVDSLEAFSKLV